MTLDNLAFGADQDTAVRKLADDQVAYLAGLLDQMHDAVIATDGELRITAWNRAAEMLYGFTPQEALGQKASDLLRSEITDEQRAAALQQQQQTGVFRAEVAVYSKAGLKLIVEGITVPKLDSQGAVTGYVSVNRDITARRQIEADLRESERKFLAIFENAPYAISLTDAKTGIFIDVNPAWEQLFGHQKEAVLGHTTIEMGIVLDIPARERFYQEFWEHKKVRGYEMTLHTRGGPILVSGNADLVTISEKEYVLLTIENITERKRAENALRHSEELFSRAFRASPSGLAITRLTDGRIIDANDRFLQIVGYSRDEVLGRTTVELGFHASAETRAEILRGINEPGGVKNLEIRFPTKTGELITALYSLELVQISGEDCLLSTFMDVSELRRLETERIAAQAEMEVQRRLMEQREQERQAIARDIHDGPIQTLSSTSFHLKLIKETFTDPELQVELNQVSLSVRKSVQELRDVVNDLRPPALIHFGLSRAIQIYTEDIRDRHPEIQIDVKVMDDGKRMADQTRLALFRVYQEGLNNILHHSGATRAMIIYKVLPHSFTLELRDNGKGFELPKDFSLLTRGGHYGLAGMKERAEAVGAKFKITSHPQRGTIVQIKGLLS